jgi:hypothetical protein
MTNKLTPQYLLLIGGVLVGTGLAFVSSGIALIVGVYKALERVKDILAK